MKDKLAVGMYVRTEKGIYKINYFINNNYTQKFTYIDNKDVSNILEEKEIIKVSHNIIDLIQAGDYVNGLRVEKSKYGELYTSYTYMGGDIGLQQETYTTFLKDYEEDDVYSILTREQFESMSYKVGEINE